MWVLVVRFCFPFFCVQMFFVVFQVFLFQVFVDVFCSFVGGRGAGCFMFCLFCLLLQRFQVVFRFLFRIKVSCVSQHFQGGRSRVFRVTEGEGSFFRKKILCGGMFVL